MLNQPVGIPYVIPTRYVGPAGMNVIPIKRFPREPLITDKKYRIGQVAIVGRNPSTGLEGDLWYLARFESNGDAMWRPFTIETPVTVINGGSGRSEATPYAVICGGTTSTSPHQSVVDVGTASQVLTSNGAGQLPTFQNAGGGGGGGAWTFVSSATASNSATIEFNNLTEQVYKVVINNLVGVTDNISLRMRMSNDNGATFEITNYQWDFVFGSTAMTFDDGSNNDDSMRIQGFGLGNQAGEFGLNAEVNFYNLNNASGPGYSFWQSAHMTGVGDNSSTVGSGMSARDDNLGSHLDIDAVQFFMSTGNISRGTFYLYTLVVA